MEGEEGRLVVMGRAEIDTRPPFRSVKEAVSLFGEKVLAGEIYANKLKEMRGRASESGHSQSRKAAITAELEETKQSLQTAREEAALMASCMKSLKEELEKAKKELQTLKAKKQPILVDDDPETEDIKFIETATREKNIIMKTQFDDDDDDEFGKKRYVRFASPPSLTKVIANKEEMLKRRPSGKKTVKRKSLVPILGWLFSKKKG